MSKSIKHHLTQELKTLEAFRMCLEQEASVLKKGSADEILALVGEKRKYIQTLNDLEAQRLHLVKQKTFADLEIEFPKDAELKRLRQNYQTCCHDIQRLSRANAELTEFAQKVANERMAFYTELVREGHQTKRTYTRGGSYQKVSTVGSTIIERTL